MDAVADRAVRAKPFIKKIVHGEHRYIYDVVSNEIIEVEPLIYDLVDDLDSGLEAAVEKHNGKYAREEIRQGLETLDALRRDHGFLSAHRPEIRYELEVSDVVHSLSSLDQLILEVTRQCNLRCKYCVVSGFYSDDEVRGNSMPLEVARKAVDYFFAHTDPKKEAPALSFYGGEPLLKLDLIKAVVAYTRERHSDRKVRFSFTTNGLLLKKNGVLDFLRENEFNLLVSLDGPKRVHDRYRVTPGGSGSFETIMGNLVWIKETAPDYFDRHVRLNVVIAPPFDYEEIKGFFYENPFFADMADRIRFSFVSDNGTSFFEDHTEGLAALGKQVAAMRARYDEALVKGTSHTLPFENNIFLQDYNGVAFRPGHRLKSFQAPVGQCLPGARRVFVSTEGSLHMCEKADTYAIGDVEQGFDYEKIHAFLMDYARFFKGCKSCWALRLCHKCFVSLDQELDPKKKNELCRGKRRQIEQNLLSYCSVMEQNPKAFEAFKRYKFH